MAKKTDDEIMSANCNVTVIFLTCGQFGAIRQPLIATFYLTKTENTTKKSLTHL